MKMNWKCEDGFLYRSNDFYPIVVKVIHNPEKKNGLMKLISKGSDPDNSTVVLTHKFVDVVNGNELLVKVEKIVDSWFTSRMLSDPLINDYDREMMEDLSCWLRIMKRRIDNE